MPAPAELLKLVEQFRQDRETYLSESFTDTSMRRQFIDPMFELLAWDVLNRQGHAEAYKEVVHEDSLKIGGSTKSPDYSFRVGPERKFFVEIQKPSGCSARPITGTTRGCSTSPPRRTAANCPTNGRWD